jgi:hypothetical protein
MVFPLLAIAVTSAVANLGWSAAGRQTPAALGGWLALEALVYELAVLGVPLLRACGVCEPDCRWPLGVRWAAVWGIFGGLLAVSCALRGWLAVKFFGIPLDWLALLGPAPGILLVFCGFEFHAAFRQAVRAQQTEIDAKLAQLFLSQAAMLRMRDRTAEEVKTVTIGQVAPALDDARQRLSVLADQARTGHKASGAELAAISGQLRHVNDEGLRQLSHLLHPSVIKLGLLPALRALAQYHDERFGVDIHASQAVVAADRLLDGSLSLDERLVVYRIVEAALDGVARHPEPGGVVVGLSLLASGELGLGIEGSELGLGIVGLESGLGSNGSEPGLGASLAWTFFESRLQLAGGRFEVGRALEGGVRLFASLPFGARPVHRTPPSAEPPAFGPFSSGGA